MDSNKKKSIEDAGIIGATAETVQRYGSAVKEHIVAYNGVDNESGVRNSKNLKDIAKSKVDDNYKDTNTKQQAGFSAEVKTTARENAEKIINGEKTRTTRTDDMENQSDGTGKTIGGTNDQLYDIAEVDKNGIYVEGTGRQLKFVGGTPEQCADKLLAKGYDKYRDADVPIEVPSDFYDDVQKILSEKAEKLKKQIENAEKKGNTELAEKKREQLERIEKTKKNLRKGKVSNKEAVEARLHPKLSTAKDIAKLSHRAGCQGAKYGALVGGGMAFINNSVAVFMGDKEITDAVADIATDTAKAAGKGYATAFTGAALKGCMQNAPSKYIRALSKTNLPGTVITIAVDTCAALKRFATGKTDAVECLTELGEKGAGMVAAAAGAAVGEAIIPIPVIGDLIGGMVGYAMSSTYYNNLVNVLKEAKIAREERIQIEAECQAAIEAIREYRLQIELVCANYLKENIKVFNEAFADMDIAYRIGNTDGFIHSANKITEQLGGKPIFETKQQFDLLMSSSEIIKI